jgi:predicted transcriptional regulator
VETSGAFKEYIEILAKEKAPGPSTTFSMFHIFYALELLSQEPVGRNKLAGLLGVGEGAIRTIIRRLQEAGLIRISKEGSSLTEKGLKIWKRFEELFPARSEIEKNDLTHSEYNYAFLVKNIGNKVKSGIDQRDAAIMGGARRAVVIVAKKGHLVIESVSSSVEIDFPTAATKILKNIKPDDNDVIIVAGAEALLKAKRGAFAAAWVLISD